MINRYQGNSGKVVKIQEGSGPKVYGEKPCPPKREQPCAKSRPTQPTPRRSQSSPVSGGVQSVLSQLGKLLPVGGGKMAALETEDIILLLILYLMYRESGDSELLMMMGAMFLL